MTDSNGHPLQPGDRVKTRDDLGCWIYGTLSRLKTGLWYIEYEDRGYVVLNFSDVFKADQNENSNP